MTIDGLPTLYIATAAVSALGSLILARWHDRIPILDIPNARSSHASPKPRSGGLAILLGLLSGCGLAMLSGRTNSMLCPAWILTLGGAAGIFLLGLLDDIFGLPEWQRLLVQIALSAVVAVWGPRLQTLDFPGMSPVRLSAALSVILTVFWYVGFINVFNFMDGTDGIAAGEAALAGLVIALLGGGLLPLLVSAAALGFLPFNYQPSRIFMGDGGSYIFGYLLAVSAVIGSGNEGRQIPVGAFVLVLGTFIMDATVTLLRRIYQGEAWFKAHRSHYYQKLTDLGWSHARIFWSNLALTAALSISAFIYAAWGALAQGILTVGWGIVFAWGILWIHAEERRRSAHAWDVMSP
jgi:UDP-N-acetylmuramyl pentapeptide phosphotransferase/UDP-N-acetylglucosamine-1-phosphate transferase